VVALSSSDTEEALKLLFSCPPHGPVSQVSEPFSGSGSDQFEDWPKANDMAASAYVALTTDVLRSHTTTVNAPHGDRVSRANISSTRRSRSWVSSSRKPHRQKPAAAGTPWRKSKKMKTDTGHPLVVPTPCGGSLSAADFDRSEWEIMYPLFVEGGLINPSKHVNRGDVSCFVSVM
jgi:hypothetical protein